MAKDKVYLGDGVYATFEWGQIILMTENGDIEPTNTICLESNVYAVLVEFANTKDSRRAE